LHATGARVYSDSAGFRLTSTGKLSAELLPPHNLSQVLQQVALRLTTDVSLLAGTNLEDMFVYYEMAKVQAYASPSEIRLTIRLPLRGADSDEFVQDRTLTYL